MSKWTVEDLEKVVDDPEVIKGKNLSNFFTTRFSDDELELLNELALSIGESKAYVVRLALDHLHTDLKKLLEKRHLVGEEYLEVRRALDANTLQIRKAGCNLNQLARKAYIDGYSSDLNKQVLRLMSELDRRSAEIYSALGVSHADL